MKRLKFDQKFIPDILSGEINTTWRLFDDKNLDIGDVFEIVNSQNGSVVGYGKIYQVISKYLKDIDNNDQTGYEKYSGGIKQIVDDFKKYYGDQVDENTPIKVIRFEYFKEKIEETDVNKSTVTEVKIYADGGSRGNPGPSACAYAIFDKEGGLLKSGGLYLGITTNNQAEYQAVKLALNSASKMKARVVHFFLDSLLVVNQMNGVYKIRNRDLWPIHQDIANLSTQFKKVTFSHIPRALNKVADEQVNYILDNYDNNNYIESDLL